MRLDDDYTLTADRYSWALTYEHVNKKANKDGSDSVSRHQTWHGTLEQALLYYVDQSLKNKSADASAILRELALMRVHIEGLDLKRIKPQGGPRHD